MKDRRLRFGFSTVLILFSMVPLVLSISIISAISLNIMGRNQNEAARDTLSIVANNLVSYCKENDITVMNASNYYDYLDSLKGYGIEMAIIMEGVPGATSIKNENDFRIREIEFDKSLTDDRDEIMAGYYDDHVEIDGKVYFGYYLPLVEGGNIYALAFAGELQDKVTGATNSVIVSIVAVAIVLFVLMCICALIFTRGMSKSFATLGSNMRTLSEGDLSRQAEHKSMVKEIHNLLGATETMQSNLSATIGNVKTVSQDLVENITKVTELSDNNTKSAIQITSLMDELNASTTVMGDNVQDISNQMAEIENCVTDISVSVEQLYNNSANILQANKDAKVNMDTIYKNSQKSVSAVNDIAEQIRQTNESITEIDNVVELILDISEQTSLLSLNASIEAARAGGFGRGFAVVADEIRKLSEQSTQGAEMIRNLAQTITEKSQRSVELADNVNSLILMEQESVAVTQQKYEELSKDINHSVKEIESIAEKTENLTSYKDKVIKNVQELSGISEENAANSREVNTNVGNIINEVRMVNENCEKMSGIAKTLEESVSYFHD